MVFWLCTIVSEVHAASIFRVEAKGVKNLIGYMELGQGSGSQKRGRSDGHKCGPTGAGNRNCPFQVHQRGMMDQERDKRQFFMGPP